MLGALLSLLCAITSVTPDGGIVIAKGQRFQAEVARTPKEQEIGLMRRQSLAKDRCMIFIYTEDGNHTIWMKNCLISLDVVWVDADGKIVEIAEKVPPPSPLQVRKNDYDYPVYGGTVPARHFVEFPAGTVKRLGLKTGDRIGWDLTLSDGTKVKGGLSTNKVKTVPKKRKK